MTVRSILRALPAVPIVAVLVLAGTVAAFFYREGKS